MPTVSSKKTNFLNNNFKVLFNEILIGLLFFALILNFIPDSFGFYLKPLLILVAYIGLAPVLYSAVKALVSREITIDLLASIALLFTFIQGEWMSAVFINLIGAIRSQRHGHRCTVGRICIFICVYFSCTRRGG